MQEENKEDSISTKATSGALKASRSPKFSTSESILGKKKKSKKRNKVDLSQPFIVPKLDVTTLKPKELSEYADLLIQKETQDNLFQKK